MLPPTAAGGGREGWTLHLGTRSFGRVDDVRETRCRGIRADGSRVELDHGSLVEWFVNDERGIEQGWTIDRRPPGTEPIEIGLRVAGDLSLRIDPGARSGGFVDSGGTERVDYVGLVAWDAAGRELDALLAQGPEGPILRVVDEGAVYPVTVDPLASGPAWTESLGDEFGFSLSSAGDVNGDGYSDVIVGAPAYHLHEGRAYVYHGSSSGLPSSPSWTANPLSQNNSRFGKHVALAGDVDGDGYSDVAVSSDVGVYVFHGSADGLEADPGWSLLPSQVGQSGVSFDAATAAGDVNGDGYSDLLLGAKGYSDTGIDQGRALVFHGSPGGLSAVPDWTRAGQGAGDSLGSSVSTAGDVNGDGYSDVIVGAPGYSNGEASEGAAFVYHGSPSGLGGSAAWTVESNMADAQFGGVVTNAGDVNGDGHSDVIVLTSSVSINIVRGYHGSAAGLDPLPSWSPGPPSNGYAVSSAGDVNGDGYSDVILGDRYYTESVDLLWQGRALAFLGSSQGLPAVPSVEVMRPGDPVQVAQFGYSVSCAGDVNGDGYSDVVIGAPLFDGTFSNEGRVFLYLGSPDGLGTTPAWTASSGQGSSQFGFAVAWAGDVDGDGFSDVIVGAPFHDAGESNEGRAFLYRGSPSGLAPNPSWTAESDQAQARFGYSLSTCGDYNGDGYSDVVIGAHLYDGIQVNSGRIFIFRGSSDGLVTFPLVRAGAQPNGFYGFSVASAGDVDGDGYSEILVGEYGYDGAEVDQGRVALLFGPNLGSEWESVVEQDGARFGYSVSGGGDLNGDGYADLVAGALLYDDGQADEGGAFVHLGNEGRGPLRSLSQRHRTGTRPVARLGHAGTSGLLHLRVEVPINLALHPLLPAPTAWLEWEVKPLGVPFDGSNVERGTPQTIPTGGGSLILEELVALSDDRPHLRFARSRQYSWRLRVATGDPLLPHTAWFSIPGSNRSEAKVRRLAVGVQ